jgi:hypothetical protein
MSNAIYCEDVREDAHDIASALAPAPAPVLDRLASRAQEHYFPPAAAMRLDVVAIDGADSGRRFEFDKGLSCSVIEFTPSLSRAGSLHPVFEPALRTATLRLPTSALDWLFAHPHEIDLRSAAFATACRGLLAIEGDAFVVEFWLQLLKRPTAQTLVALELARTLAPRSPRTIDTFFGGPLDGPLATRSVERAILLRMPCLLRRSIGPIDAPWRRAFEAASLGDYSGGAAATTAMREALAWPALPPAAFSGVQLWAGQSRTGVELTRLHCDPLTSLLAQLVGHKQLLLFSPQEHDRLYPMDAFNGHQPCRVNPRRPDLARFPLFQDARAMLVTLAPGDLLVIPTGWFHTTWAHEPVASLSRFVDDDLLA